MKPKATITITLTFNGHPVELNPSRFTVQDGDNVEIDVPVGLSPVVEPKGPGDVVIVREVIRPTVGP